MGLARVTTRKPLIEIHVKVYPCYGVCYGLCIDNGLN